MARTVARPEPRRRLTWPGALLRDPRLARTTFIMETPGVDEGWDAVNMRRAWLLWRGETQLPTLPPKAFRTNRRSTRVVRTKP